MATQTTNATLYDQWQAVQARFAAEEAAQQPQLPAATDSRGRALRHDGWTPDRQCAFLKLVSQGHTVNAACDIVGL